MGIGDLSVTKSLFGSSSSPGVFGTGQQRFTPPQMGNTKKDANGNPIIDITKQPGESDEDYTHRAERYFNGDASAGNVVYETDPYKAWQDPQYDQNKRNLNEAAVQLSQRRVLGEGTGDPNAKVNRGDIQQVSGVSVSPTEQFQQGQGAYVGQYERAKAAQLSPAERITAERIGQQNIGQANVYGGAQIDPAAQARAAQLGRQDAEFRSGQTQLMSQLQDQAAGRGPSLAAGQLQEASDRTLAQQNAAAAAGGGNAALARRQLAVNAAQQNQQTARDVAQTRMQEQMSARQQLQGVTQTGREQDINVANAQAQLQQQTALANQAAINSRAGQQAGLTQQAGLAGMEALNQRQYQQAAMNMQGNLANQQAGMQAMLANQQYGNQFALQQGQMNQQVNLANMQEQNQRQALQAQLYQQGGLQYQQLQQQQKLQEGGWAQQAGLANQQYMNQALFANQQAALQNQQMNDAMARYYSEAGLGLDARQQQAMMAYQTQQQNTALGYAGLEQKAYEGAREGIGGMMGGIGGMIGGLAMMSDEEVKNSVTRGDSKISDFLEQYGKNESLDEAMAPTQEKSGGGGFFGGFSGAVGSAGAMSAMSDNKVKDLSNENDKLKAQLVGQSMSSGAHGKGFFGGLGSGIASGAKASAAQDASKNAPKKIDPSSTMSPVMNNPNAAIAMPSYSSAQMMTPSYGGLGVRDNPYGAAPAMQTWGVPPADPTFTPPSSIPSNMTNAANPYDVPTTWSDENMKSYSPMGMKTGINSGDMKVSNFLDAIKGSNTGSGPANPTDYGNTMSMSDKRIKEFLDKQEAYDYEYKPEYKGLPGAGEGRFVSPMAQDLAKTELGKSMVKPGPDGKLQVDYGKGFGTILAAQAYLNDRLNKLEGKKGKK